MRRQTRVGVDKARGNGIRWHGDKMNRSMDVDPSSARTQNELGITLERAGDGEAAESAYRASIALGPKNARAHLLLGELLERRGARGEAIEHYRAALAVNPNLRGAREALERAVSQAPPDS